MTKKIKPKTPKERAGIIASRVASKARAAYTPYLQDVAEACVVAGWHARGRDERIAHVWVVANKTTAAVFASEEAANVWVSSKPSSLAGGFTISKTPLFRLIKCARRKV